MLEDAGIGTFVHNIGSQQLGLTTAFFPLPLFFPTLSVLRDEDYGEAMTILRTLRDTAPMLPNWVCQNCEETVPGSLTACWNCEQAR